MQTHLAYHLNRLFGWNPRTQMRVLSLRRILRPSGSGQRGCFFLNLSDPPYFLGCWESGLVDIGVLFFSSFYRTQDKAILEAAYNANPKPDKAARLDIVKRVSLNEKEVQVCIIAALDVRGRVYMSTSRAVQKKNWR